MSLSDTYEVTFYNNYRTSPKNYGIDEIPCRLNGYDFISKFYNEQSAKTNKLRKVESFLLDEAALVRRKMIEIQSISEKSNEWHKLNNELDIVEAQLIQISAEIDGFD